MHHRARMSRRQALPHLDRDVDRCRHGQRTTEHLSRQRFPDVVRHHDEGASVAGFLQSVDRANVGMVERRRRPRLAQKPLFVLAAGNQVLRKELQRNRALQLHVERAIYHAHAPGSGQAEDFVVADEISRGQSGVYLRHRASPNADQPQRSQRLSAPGQNRSGSEPR